MRPGENGALVVLDERAELKTLELGIRHAGLVGTDFAYNVFWAGHEQDDIGSEIVKKHEPEFEVNEDNLEAVEASLAAVTALRGLAGFRAGWWPAYSRKATAQSIQYGIRRAELTDSEREAEDQAAKARFKSAATSLGVIVAGSITASLQKRFTGHYNDDISLVELGLAGGLGISMLLVRHERRDGYDQALADHGLLETETAEAADQSVEQEL